ncbi:MAG: OmpA family protein, partial [Pseudomonadota bacterium]
MRSTRFARLGAVALLGGALLGCSAQKEDAAAGAGAASAASASAAAAAVDESSIEFFRVSVGDRVFFSVDSSDLTPEGRSTLDRQARWLTLNPDIAITLEGHADERGTR